MNSFVKIITLVAILAATLVTVSCNKESGIDNPNYDPETKTVNANFVFNIATNVATKQTASDTQYSVTDASGFRGIESVLLFSYVLGSDGKTIVDGSETIGKSYDLQRAVGPGALNPGASDSDSDKSRRIVELSIPMNTNTFLFYGKAIKSGSDNAQGKISFNVNVDDIRDSRFSLIPRFDRDATFGTSKIGDAFDQTELLITTIVSRILNNGFNGNTTYDKTSVVSTFNGETSTKSLRWSSFASYSGGKWSQVSVSPVDGVSALTPLEEILSETFVRFANTNPGEIRAGSGLSIERMVGDMAVALGKVSNATPTSLNEMVAKNMANRILTRFANYFYIGDVTTLSNNFANIITDGEDCHFLSASLVISNLIANATDPANSNAALFKSEQFSAVHDTYLRNFPTEFGLPMGSAQLLLSTDDTTPHTMTAKYDSDNISLFDGSGTTSISKYVYPAELCYFGNSPIRVTDTALEKKDYPDGAGNSDGEWLNSSSWGSKGWSSRGSHVISTTRSVALADNINYGTALLVSSVGYETSDPIEDNNHHFNSSEENNKFTPRADDFLITGILVGGQYDKMGWNYVKADDSGQGFIVYDRIEDPVDALSDGSKAISVPASGQSAQNYTLLWDNFNGSTTQDEVYVAIEFVNNTGKDFWGATNIIRKNGTFYIVGRIKPNDADASAIEWPADPDFYALPPYNADGTTNKVVRAFIQDFVTTANFKLNKTSLQHAYVTVPDLRSTQMSLGLSVDLKWRAGLTFTPVLGAN